MKGILYHKLPQNRETETSKTKKMRSQHLDMVQTQGSFPSFKDKGKLVNSYIRVTMSDIEKNVSSAVAKMNIPALVLLVIRTWANHKPFYLTVLICKQG